MITLYTKPGCPFCAMVIAKIDNLGVEYTELSISDPEVAEELIEKGGKRQTPYLVDDATGESMYESSDIVDYLDTHYGKKEDA